MENLNQDLKKLGKNKVYLILIGLAAIIFAMILIYAYVDFSGTKISPVPTEEGKPYCANIGTRSEGWVGDGLSDIKYDNCDGCSAVCMYVGTRVEGWYVSGNCDSGLNLIKYANCGEKGCYSDSDCYGITIPIGKENQGITIPIGKEVYTVETTFDVVPMMIQALRDGHHAEAEKISNCELRITVEEKEIELIKKYEWVKKITRRFSQFCEFPEGECKGPGKCADKLVNGGCAAVWTPVCGCDGKTYSNDCYRQRAGVSKKHGGECDGENKCTDTDGGKDYYKKGTVTGKMLEPTGGTSSYNVITGEEKNDIPNKPIKYVMATLTDYCSRPEIYPSEERLVEYYCKDDGIIGNEFFKCPNGCKDGACIKEAEEITCDEKCKSLNYKSGICRTWPIVPDAERGCKENEKDVGETSDCYLPTLHGQPVLGVDKTCCCQEKIADCAKEGEAPTDFDFTTGEINPNGKKCCEGLKAIGPKTSEESLNQGICAHVDGGPGVCRPCGDKICDSEFEDKCNCPEDCKEEQTCQDSFDCPAKMKCENSVCVSVGCVKEGDQLPGAWPPEDVKHMATECCAGLEEIGYAGYYDETCNTGLVVMYTSGGPGGTCAKCGNGICGLGETRCNCPEDCKKETEPSLSADLNCNNRVGPADFAILLGSWGQDPSGSASCQSPDINKDGNVGPADFAVMMGQWKTDQGIDHFINCGEDYDCLYQQISNGNSAKVVITEEIKSLSLIEKSEVKIEPVNNKYQVSMKVLDLKEIKKEKFSVRSIVGSISKTCPQIINNLDKVKSKSAACIAGSAEEAKQLAINGLTEDAIKNYNCKGSLINVINEICVTPDFPHFPPGVKKPAVYLYPKEKSEIEVNLSINGFITKSEPDYLLGWNVTAEPDGLIDNEYDYLFYETQLNNLELPDKGWVVEYSNLENWFDKNLPQLGLNQKEISQFKEYWLDELEEANYYEIKLLDEKFLTENMNLIINPQPDTTIRRNFYFKPLNEKVVLAEPTISTPERIGFTVVEWGGLLDE